MSKGISIAMAAVTFGALAVSAAAVVGAFVVIDQRAAQVLKAEPRLVPAAKKNPASPHASRRLDANASRQAQTVGSAGGQSAVQPAQTSQERNGGGSISPDKIVDSQKKLRRESHHTRRHGRRFAHSSREPQESGQAVSSAQGTQAASSPGLFFPFH